MEVIKGSDLKTLLKKKGITQQDVIKKFGIGQSLISKYYTNEIKEMPASFLIKVAIWANLELKDLVVDYDNSDSIASEPQFEYERLKKDPKYLMEMITEMRKEISMIREVRNGEK